MLRATIERALAACEETARRVGVSRREFLLSICGAATTLAMLNACAREAHRADPHRVTSEPGGAYLIPTDAMVEPDLAHEVIGGDEFVFDLQGHLLEYHLNPVFNGQDFWTRFPQQNCGESDPRVCFSIDHFMELMFLRSDTSMLVLSALPIYPEGSPLSPRIMNETRLIAEGLCRDKRVLLQGQALPNVGRPEVMLDGMESTARRYPIAAWKTFTHFPAVFEGNRDAWWLDDHDPSLPQVGERFIRKARELDIPTISIHKGLSGGSPYASPMDVGPAARKHPDVNFVIYHSGFESGVSEGPYTWVTRNVGVNRLIRSMKRAEIGPNQNVYAELGSTWWYVMRYPTQAAHVLGKLLKHVGENNVVWGTDCLFYGSPQDQIQAMRSFHISAEFQERYGYPELTRRIKAKILGLNGARVYGIEPITTGCEFTRRELEQIRRQLPGRNRTLGPETRAEAERIRRHHREEIATS